MPDMWMWWMGVVMALDPADLLPLHNPVPEGVQFFAATLTMPTEPPDSTLAFGAVRQGLFLTSTQAVFHVIEDPGAGGSKVPGEVVQWSIPREEVQSVQPVNGEPCIELVTSQGSRRVCLAAIAHHRDTVLTALSSWHASIPAPATPAPTDEPTSPKSP